MSKISLGEVFLTYGFVVSLFPPCQTTTNYSERKSMIKVKVTAPTGTIILDRPERCNALSREMVEQLSQAFDDLRQEKRVRGIVLTGAGTHFCSGVDLRQWHDTLTDKQALTKWFEDSQGLLKLFEQMLQLPKPIVAAVDGRALGAGFGLVLASDLVVATQRACFGSLAATSPGLRSACSTSQFSGQRKPRQSDIIGRGRTGCPRRQSGWICASPRCT